MTINKPILPRNLSYVLRASLLQAALDEAQIDCDVSLNYWMPRGGGSVLEAFYWLPNACVPYPRVYIRAGVVPSTERKPASHMMTTSILPAFVRWLVQILALPDHSPLLRADLRFDATYQGGKTTIASAPFSP